MMYILDEPSIGLHQRDNSRLLNTLFHLRDLGNTVIVVEHDEEAIRSADHVIDIGPGAGVHGGCVVAEGVVKKIEQNKKSLTGKFLSGKEKILIPKRRTTFCEDKFLELKGVKGNNLKSIDCKRFGYLRAVRFGSVTAGGHIAQSSNSISAPSTPTLPQE